MKFKSSDEIKGFLLAKADLMGIEIVDVETKISKNSSITIVVDTIDGVDLNTLEKFHNAIDPLLDELDPSFGEPYTLNVSSPGLDRPFKSDRDFEKNLGQLVEVKLFVPLRGKKNFECELIGYDGKNVTLRTDEQEEFKLPLTRIAKINKAIIFD